jgi:hypothetical protein
VMITGVSHRPVGWCLINAQWNMIIWRPTVFYLGRKLRITYASGQFWPIFEASITWPFEKHAFYEGRNTDGAVISVEFVVREFAAASDPNFREILHRESPLGYAASHTLQMTERVFNRFARLFFSVALERLGDQILRSEPHGKHQCKYNSPKKNAESKLNNGRSNS